MTHSVDVQKLAIKDLSGIPEASQKLIACEILDLGRDPRPRGYAKIKGGARCRIRIGKYRILYEIDKKNRRVAICRVKIREDAFRRAYLNASHFLTQPSPPEPPAPAVRSPRTSAPSPFRLAATFS